MSFLSSLFGGNNQPGSAPAAPTFQADSLVNQTDQSMFNFGSNVLQGILPTQYQSLLQTNSPQFQTMLNNSNAQIQGSSMSTAAMQGNARSGAAQAGATQAIASNTANLSYQDLLNTQINQKALLGTGLNAIQAANQGALGNQGQINQFSANIYGDQTQQYDSQLGYDANMAKLSGSLAGQLLGSNGIGGLISNLPFLGGVGGASAAGAAGATAGVSAAGALGADAAAGGIADTTGALALLTL